MTCRGEPANYDTRDAKLDIGNKYSNKYSIGRDMRYCQGSFTTIAPGPGN